MTPELGFPGASLPGALVVLMLRKMNIHRPEPPGSADSARPQTLLRQPGVGLGGGEGGRVQGGAWALLFPSEDHGGLGKWPCDGAVSTPVIKGPEDAGSKSFPKSLKPSIN